MEAFWVGKENLKTINTQENTVLSATNEIKNEFKGKYSKLYFQIGLILTDECKLLKPKLKEVKMKFKEYFKNLPVKNELIDPTLLVDIITENMSKDLKELKNSFKISELANCIMFNKATKLKLEEVSFIDLELKKDSKYCETRKYITQIIRHNNFELSPKQLNSIIDFIKVQSNLLSFNFKEYIVNTKIKEGLKKITYNKNISFKELLLTDKELRREIFEVFLSDKTQMNEAIKYYFNEKGIALSSLEVDALLRNKVISYKMSKVVSDMLKEKRIEFKNHRKYLKEKGLVFSNMFSIIIVVLFS